MSDRAVLALIAIAALVLLLAFGMPARAEELAHGEAQWILDGKYKAKDGLSCCDVHDCKRHPASRFRKAPEGIWFTADDGQKFLMPWTDRNKGLHGSESADWWACFREIPGQPGKYELRCVFIPPGRGA